MSFYLFIAISFYLNIVCKNIVCELGLTHTHTQREREREGKGTNYSLSLCHEKLEDRLKKGLKEREKRRLKLYLKKFLHFLKCFKVSDKFL